MGLKEVVFLDYLDKDLDKADPTEAVSKIVGHVRRVRPQVVITFGPEGAYGHPDHIAISQLATAAVVSAADARYGSGLHGAHRVSKLYFMAWPEGKWKAYQAAFRNIAVQVDGKERRPSPWPEWAITTVIDTARTGPRSGERFVATRRSWPCTGNSSTCRRISTATFGDHRSSIGSSARSTAAERASRTCLPDWAEKGG